MALIGAIMAINQVAIIIAKYFAPDHAAKLTWTYLLIHVVITDLIYFDMLGDNFYVEDKAPFDI